MEGWEVQPFLRGRRSIADYKKKLKITVLDVFVKATNLEDMKNKKRKVKDFTLKTKHI